MSTRRYTYELTNTSYAREHALHCFSMRPDDIVEHSKILKLDLLTKTKNEILTDDALLFLLCYDNGEVFNNVFVCQEFGSRIYVKHSLAAPTRGSLSYLFDTDIYPQGLDFFASQGYTEYSQRYIKGHGSEKILRFHADKCSKYTYNVVEGEGLTGYCTIDLINTKG